MTSDDLRAWQVFMNLGDRAAAKALGFKAAEYASRLSGSVAIDQRTALACAALAEGLSPWGSHDGLDRPQLKPRQQPRHLLPVHD